MLFAADCSVIHLDRRILLAFRQSSLQGASCHPFSVLNLYFTPSSQCFLFFLLEVTGIFRKGEELLKVAMTWNGPMNFAGLSPLFKLCFNGWESALQWTQNREFSALRACTSLIFMLILVVSRTTATKKLWPPTLEPPRRECAHRVDIMSCVFAAYYVLGEISSYPCSSKLNSNVSVYLLSLSVRSISWVVWV